MLVVLRLGLRACVGGWSWGTGCGWLRLRSMQLTTMLSQAWRCFTVFVFILGGSSSGATQSSRCSICKLRASCFSKLGGGGGEGSKVRPHMFCNCRKGIQASDSVFHRRDSQRTLRAVFNHQKTGGKPRSERRTGRHQEAQAEEENIHNLGCAVSSNAM